MHVAALYRHPLKGFTPEQCEALTVLDGGRIAGDRVLGIRFADAAAQGEVWGTKHEFVVLVNSPGLARLHVAFDHATLRLRITDGESTLVDGGLDGASRRRLAAAIEAYVLGLEENPLSGQPQRLPLQVVGDGRTPRFQDAKDGFATLHGRASLAAVAQACADPGLDERRFRSNIAIEGARAWAEQGWIGRTVHIGAVAFEVSAPKTRCLATHANPSTGERDQPLMRTLLEVLPTQRPTFAIAMSAVRGGVIRVGDEVRLAA